MKNTSGSPASGGRSSSGLSGKSWWILGGGILVIALAFLLPRGGRSPATGDGMGAGGESGGGGEGPAGVMRERARARGFGVGSVGGGGGGAGGTPERMVSDRVYSFVRDQRRLVEDIARQLQVDVPPQVHEFFQAAEGGDWGNIKRLFNTLSSERGSSEAAPGLATLWPAIQDAYNAAQTAASWSPAELLDYGQQMAGNLPPGAVYLAGSEAAKSITSLMTPGGGDGPLVMSAAGVRDGAYQEFLAYAAAQRLTPLTREEMDSVIQAASAEARPGADGGDAGAGAAAEAPLSPGSKARLEARLLQMLIEKNPGVTFVLEQADQALSMDANAVPKGPFIEVRAGGGGGAGVTSAQAGATLEYWRETAQRLQADASLAPDAPSRVAYAGMAAGQAEFFAARNFKQEAEQAYRLAREIAPASADPLRQYAQFLTAEGRQGEAFQMIDEFAARNDQLRHVAEDVRRSLGGTPAP